MDPIRNPYAPGAGQRPPELAGRDEQLAAFDVVLERVARGRPERSLVLTGLRGVGKTVLLNALRWPAVRRRWGTGKLEARPDQPLRRPLSARCTRPSASSATRRPDEVDHVLGVIRAFAQREAGAGARLRDQWNPGIDAPAVSGRADSGDIEIDLVELFTDVGGLAADLGKGVAVFIDEMQDLGPDDVVRALRAPATRSASPGCRSSSSAPGCRTCRRCSAPASRTPSGCSATSASTGCRARRPTARSPRRPRTRTPRGRPTRSPRCTPPPAATPTSSRPTARPCGTARPRSPITAADVEVAAPEAEAELAVGFFGSRYDRATPAERDYLRAMADVAVDVPTPVDGPADDSVLDRRRRRVARQEAAVALARRATRC